MKEEVFTDTLKEIRANHKGKTVLTIKELSGVIGVSDKTVREMIKDGRGLPNFLNIGASGKRKQIRFPIIEVARFVADTQRVY